jgi:hypothetical protein
VNISVQKLLTKIEAELKLAKTSTKEESLREKVYSIKILCELLLDEKPSLTSDVPAAPMNQPIVQQAPTLQQPKKLDMADEANGDSLFDF